MTSFVAINWPTHREKHLSQAFVKTDNVAAAFSTWHVKLIKICPIKLSPEKWKWWFYRDFYLHISHGNCMIVRYNVWVHAQSYVWREGRRVKLIWMEFKVYTELHDFVFTFASISRMFQTFYINRTNFTFFMAHTYMECLVACLNMIPLWVVVSKFFWEIIIMYCQWKHSHFCTQTNRYINMQWHDVYHHFT